MDIKYVTLLESYFDFFYAKEIIGNMYATYRKNCHGCKNAYLSQNDHTCLNITDKEQLVLYFEDILIDVDESNVLKNWNEAVSILEDLPTEVIEMYKLNIYCPEWRENEMKNLCWKNRIIKLTLKLLTLERRLV